MPFIIYNIIKNHSPYVLFPQTRGLKSLAYFCALVFSRNAVLEPQCFRRDGTASPVQSRTYVPCLTKANNKIILEKIPLHGDQLFEERARNVIWTYRDGVDEYERLEGIDTEFADWHAKYTLYKVKEINEGLL